MPNSLVFHESFDSTRTADSQSAPNLAQAQAEALVSLLLGHSLALTNTYAFDSRGVLDLVQAVLSARDDTIGTLRAGSAARRRLLRARPFLLTWYGANSFLGACAAQLRKIDPKDLDGRFLLSAWNAIDLDRDRRDQLAGILLSDPNPEPPAWLQEYPDLPEQFDALATINRYSLRHGRGRPASTEDAVDLIEYLDYYHKLGQEGVLRRLVPKWHCPEDMAIMLWERLDNELRKPDGQKKLSSRSWIHVAVRIAKEQEDDDLEVLLQLKEMIDTFYNARLAQSGYADHDFLSSVPRSSDTDDLKNVNDLAINVIGHKRPEVGRPPLEGVFTAPEDEPQLAVAPLRQLFRAYWDIIGDDGRYRTWQQSCDTVNDLLRNRPEKKSGEQQEVRRYSDWARRFRDAWADHMSLLNRELPQIVRTDDGSLRVTVRQGSSFFRHSHHLMDEAAQQPTPAELDTALATGRYVSNIKSWVNV